MSALAASQSWSLLQQLVEKDFKVRYRNMSLGILWSLINPLIMMAVLTFVFTFIFGSERRNFALFVLVGILPYNFFNLAWSSATNSIIENAVILKKVPFVREWVPISAVFGNMLHYLIQLGLLLIALAWVIGPSWSWLWLPLVIIFQLIFVSGISLLTSALDVYYRDIRYVVESAGLVLFWLCPIFYGFDQIGPDYIWIYDYNPLSAVILIMRRLLIYGEGPGLTLWKLMGVSLVLLVVGYAVFSRTKKNFSDYL